MCLVVVVGDPKVLARHPEWRSLIRYCQENRSYISNTEIKQVNPILNDETNFPALGDKAPKARPSPKKNESLFSNYFGRLNIYVVSKPGMEEKTSNTESYTYESAWKTNAKISTTSVQNGNINPNSNGSHVQDKGAPKVNNNDTKIQEDEEIKESKIPSGKEEIDEFKVVSKKTKPKKQKAPEKAVLEDPASLPQSEQPALTPSLFSTQPPRTLNPSGLNLCSLSLI